MQAPEAISAQSWDAVLSDAASRGREDLVGLSWREGKPDTAHTFAVIDHLMMYKVIGHTERKVGPPVHRTGGVVCFYRRRVYDNIMGDVPVWIVKIDAVSGATVGVLVLTEEELRQRRSAASFAWSPREHGLTTEPADVSARVQVRADAPAPALDQLWAFRERLGDNSTHMTGLTWTAEDVRVEVMHDVLVMDHGSFHPKQLRRWVVAVSDGQGRIRRVSVDSVPDAITRLEDAAKGAGKGDVECRFAAPPTTDEPVAIATVVQRRYEACTQRLGLNGSGGDEPWVATDLAAAGLDPASVPSDARWLEVVDRRLGATFAAAAVPLTQFLNINPQVINRAPDLVRAQVEAILQTVTQQVRTLDHNDLARLGQLLRRGIGV
jgi:hypothetical protein